MKSKLYIGTSGYSYQHWRGGFYPVELKENKWLEFYCSHFNTVELNVTFYRLPNKKAFETWRNKTPKDFKFVVKGSRYITHVKKLKDSMESIRIFFENASILENKLLCVLWQMPPAMKCNPDRLREFIDNLNKIKVKCLHSFEFRHPTWFCEDVFQLLKNNNINLCIADSPDFPRSEVLTSDFIYLRFHGGKVLYGSEYTHDELMAWVNKSGEWMKKSKMLLAFFNNDACGFAVRNAMKLKEMLK